MQRIAVLVLLFFPAICYGQTPINQELPRAGQPVADKRAVVEEKAPDQTKVGPVLQWVKERDILDAKIEGALTILMNELGLDPREGWQAVFDPRVGIRFRRNAPAESTSSPPPERKP